MKVDERKEGKKMKENLIPTTTPQFHETLKPPSRPSVAAFTVIATFFYDDDGRTLSHFRAKSGKNNPPPGMTTDDIVIEV